MGFDLSVGLVDTYQSILLKNPFLSVLLKKKRQTNPKGFLLKLSISCTVQVICVLSQDRVTYGSSQEKRLEKDTK